MSEPGSKPPAISPAGARAWWHEPVVFAAALVLHGALQAALPGLIDRDAWFHGRYAELIATGAARWTGTSFPWLTHSAFATNPMDWSLLWHLLLAPFAVLLGPVAGLRVFAAVQAALLTSAFHALLRSTRVKAPLAWTALLVVSSHEWLFRLHFGRPTPFVIASLLVIVLLVLRRRDRWAAVAVAFSLLLYQVPATAALAAGAAWIGRSVDERRPAWSTAVWLAAGAVAGLLLHPGLWNGGTLHVWELMAGSLQVAADGGAVEVADGATLVLSLPRELGRPGLGGLLRELWLPLGLSCVAAVTFARARSQGASVAGAILALVGLVATWRSGRFFEYWHVFALLGAATFVSREDGPGGVAQHRRVLAVVAVVLGIVTAKGFAQLTSPRYRDGGAQVAAALAEVRARARPGDVVWHLAWDEFGPLFHFAPELRYVQGMDPWWCVAYDKDAALAYALAANGAFGGDDLREILVAGFHARYVVLWSQPEDGPEGVERRRRMEARLDAVPWAHRIHTDAATTAYELDRPSAPR